MRTREFLMHLLLNADLDDEVVVEIKIPENNANNYLSFKPSHITKIGEETLIDCKPYEEE